MTEIIQIIVGIICMVICSSNEEEYDKDYNDELTGPLLIDNINKPTIGINLDNIED